MFLVVCLAFCFLMLCCLPIGFGGVNYIEDIQLSYNVEDNIWICDRLKCPEGTFGCHIKRHNNPDNEKQLIRHNECYNYENEGILSGTWIEEMNETRRVQINFKSFLNAKNVAITGYSVSSQNFEGIIAAADWKDWKETTFKNVLAINDVK